MRAYVRVSYACAFVRFCLISILPSPVTERENWHGILLAPDVEDHCLVYIRELTNVNLTLMRIASKFMDFGGRS